MSDLRFRYEYLKAKLGLDLDADLDAEFQAKLKHLLRATWDELWAEFEALRPRFEEKL